MYVALGSLRALETEGSCCRRELQLASGSWPRQVFENQALVAETPLVAILFAVTAVQRSTLIMYGIHAQVSFVGMRVLGFCGACPFTEDCCLVTLRVDLLAPGGVRRDRWRWSRWWAGSAPPRFSRGAPFCWSWSPCWIRSESPRIMRSTEVC